MKKLILVLTATFSVMAANGQVIFSEDFDGIPGPTAGGAGTYVFPSGWFLRNVDNRTPDVQTAYVNEAWERREDFGVNVGDSVAFSNSFYSPVGQADDWMWTPLVGPITANTVLRWNARAYDPAYADGYEVRVMTQAAGPPTGGTGVLGNQVTNSTVAFSNAGESSSWIAREVSLAAYAGQSIYIGFRNNSNDKFLLVIDDVVVEHMINYDLTVSAVSHGEYTVAPAQQQTTTANFELKGTLTNLGLQAMTNATLSCDVIVDGSLLTTVQSTPVPSLASGASSSVTISYMPSVSGSYAFKFYPEATETDQSSGNDTIYDATGLIVEPSMMRRDFGAVTGSLGIGAGQMGYVGQTFRFETAVNIEAIETYMTRGYTDRELRAAIFSTDGSGVPSTLLASTDTLVYPDDSARLYTMPIYGGTLNLPAGEYAFVQVEIDSTLAVGNTNAIYTPATIYVQWPGNGPNFAPVENFGTQFNKPLVIYPKFDLCVGETGGSLDMSTQASCGLSDGTATLTLDAGYSVVWEDSTTAATHNALPAGWHTFTISNEYCSFTDSVEITNPAAPSAAVATIGDALCFGGNGTITLDIQGGTAPYTVTWSDATIGETFTGPAGTYSATIVDANNCSASVSNATINAPTEVTASVIDIPAPCFGGYGTLLLDIEGGTAPYSVFWSDGSDGETLTGPAGTYTVTVTDTNSCETTVTGTITEPTALTATVSGTDETCESCNDGTASVTLSGGTPPYDITWSNGATGSPITGLPPGTYTPTITDANGCMLTGNFVIVSEFIGIEELSDYGIVIYPNPVSDDLSITAHKHNVTAISLVDASGRLVAELTKTNETFTADMRGLAKGVYQLIIRTPSGTIVSAVAKQ